MSDPIRSAEDVAREVLGDCYPAGLGDNCSTHGSPLGRAETCLAALHLSETIRARDAEVAEQVRDETRYVVFDADWCEPPGDVIAVFATEAEAWAHIRGPGDGYGWSIVEVAAPLAGGEQS